MLKRNTEAIITAAQDQALRTNWIKGNIDGFDWFLYVEFAILWMSQACTLLVGVTQLDCRPCSLGVV